MFSGGDSSDGINSLNQFGAYGFVNQIAVSNAMAAGQNIDWAQLAQQWIQMRDNSAVEQKSQNKSSSIVIEPSSCSSKFEEKGEADMDMDDEEQHNDEKTTQKMTNTSTLQNNLNQPWFFGEETPRTATFSQWNPWPSHDVLPQSITQPTNSTAHIPSLLNINVPNPNEISVMPDTSRQPENATNMMDAVKRKGLPAWIREGLEKMEREKQKQLEKEQQNKEKIISSDEDNSSDKHIVTKPLNSVNDSVLTILNDDNTGNEDLPIAIDANKERDSFWQRDNEERETADTYSSSLDKSYEQKLSDLMTVVRRTLTELLLEVTNAEICKIADETIKIFKSKASSAQVIRKSALSTLTSKLGLAAYGDSSSEENSDDDNKYNSSKKAIGQSESENDSEDDIRNVIRQKRRAFIKTSEEIEERVASAAIREEEKLKYFLRLEEEKEERERNCKKQQRPLLKDPSSSGHSGHNIYKGYEKDFGEITETKIQNINGKRQRDRSSRKERITRFSDNKDKYVALSNATTFFTNMNTAAAASNAGNSTVKTPLNNIKRQTVSDVNSLLPTYTTAGMTNVLNAADAALEKVLKGKSASDSPKKPSRRHNYDHRDYSPSKKRQRSSDDKKRSRSKSSASSTTSSSSTTSFDSESSSTSRSSLHSKYSHRSTTKHKSHSSADRQYEKPHKDHHRKSDRKYSSSSSYRKRDHESSKSRYRRNRSSDSEDEYQRRRNHDSHYSRNSSHSRSYASSRRERKHSRSQSRSSYSSSSNRRQ